MVIGSIEDTTMPTPNIIIGQYAFYDCQNLSGASGERGIESVTLLHTYTLGNYSFQNCGAIKELHIGNTSSNIITAGNRIGSGAAFAFYGCPIENLTLDSDCWLAQNSSTRSNFMVKTLFGTNIRTLTIGQNVNSVLAGALNGLNALETLNIPFTGLSRTSLEKNAVLGVVFGENSDGVTQEYWNIVSGSTTNAKFAIPQSLNTVVLQSDTEYAIPACAFDFCQGGSPGRISIVGNITSIGNRAFLGTSIESIAIPRSVTSINDDAFALCNELHEISFISPSSLTTIGNRAFKHSGLTSINLPSSVTSIGDDVFENCSSLATVTGTENLTHIGLCAFQETPFYNSLPDGIVVIGKVAYRTKNPGLEIINL